MSTNAQVDGNDVVLSAIVSYVIVVSSDEDDEIYTDIEDYFDDVGLTVLDTETASISTSVQTEAEVKEFLEARGFGQRQIEEYTIGYPVIYTELMNGTVVDETEVEGDSDVKHPLYYTFYLANSDTDNPVLWTIYVINGNIFSYPASFITQTDTKKEVLVTEKTDGSVISYYKGTYYSLSADGESVVTPAVETIDATALNVIDFAALCSLTGANRIELYDASSADIDTYVQDSTAVVGARTSQSQSIPGQYGAEFIAIALGDSYISGESISPYIGQYYNGQAVSREDRVKDNDWVSHRSTASWPSRLSVPGIVGTLGDYYVPYQETSDADIQWYFYAISGAETKHYAMESFEKECTLPMQTDTVFGQITVEIPYFAHLPTENEVFTYIDNPKEIDYVFLSLGGNDANFANIVTDVVVHSQTLNPLTWFGEDSKLVRDLGEVWIRIEDIIRSIETVIRDIHKKAPNATIIQTGYPQLFAEGGSGWAVSRNEAKLVNEKVSDFNDMIRERIEKLADSIDVRFVDIEEKFADGEHSAYSHDNKAGVDGAWLNPVIIPSRDDDIAQGLVGIASAASVHPNEYGARAYAEAVNAVIEQADKDKIKKDASSISGVITYAEEDIYTIKPVEGATIRLDWYDTESVGSNPSYIAVSETKGGYRIDNVEPGLYNITVIKGEYPTFTDIVMISDEEGTYYNVMLGEIEGGEVKQVSLGSDHGAAVMSDGSLYTWGANYYGQLGNGETSNGYYAPEKIMDDVAYVSLGFYHSAAITTDGSLYMWGENSSGELGNSPLHNSSTPIKIMDNVVSVCLGYKYSAAITTDGSLYMWGRNHLGQLGNGTTENSSIPIEIMDNVAQVSLGDKHSAAITTDGNLYMWGSNYFGQFSNGTNEDSLTPIKVMENVAYVSLGSLDSAIVTKGGSLYICGSNSEGQFGDGTTQDSYNPVKIMDNVVCVSRDAVHSAAITTNGNLYMWGDNSFGQLGNGTTENSYVPIIIMNNVADISISGYYSAAITTDGNLYMWGRNNGSYMNWWYDFNNSSGGDYCSIPIKITLPLSDLPIH